jgi:hypothetical protein
MQLEDDTLPANGHRWKGKTDDLFQHETKATKRGRDGPTLSSKIRDILEWRTMKDGTSLHLDSGDRGSAKNTKKAAGGMRDLWKGRNIESRKNKGPKPGQMYEIANRYIIEDSIDRTVTISTWRERAEEEHSSDTDTMSIYYVGLDGYAHENDGKFERRPLGSRHGSRRETQGTSYGPFESDKGPSSISAKVRSTHCPRRNIDVYPESSKL